MTIHMKITGMHCGNCKAKVERVLKAVPGSYAVAVDLEKGEAEVDFDGKTPPERFVEAVRSLGYTAELAA
jgi:copper chaperone CopZ